MIVVHLWNVCSSSCTAGMAVSEIEMGSSSRSPFEERKTRFELATLYLASRCATAAPLPRETMNDT
jgi:hypothetical protein